MALFFLKSGIGCDHTWGDGPTLSQMYEDCIFDDLKWYDFIEILISQSFIKIIH